MRICVYGASSDEIAEKYKKEIYGLGEEMARRGMGLVYGGGAQGLMGAVARGMHDHGGKILGVAPDFFQVDGVLFEECDDFIYTKTMRERKQIMEDNADAFIMTPGGFGTFEEFFEIITLKQLERHFKAIVIYNVDGYYDAMIRLIEQSIEQKFTKPACRQLYEIVTSANQALDYIENYKPVRLGVKNLRNVESQLTFDAHKI